MSGLMHMNLAAQTCDNKEERTVILVNGVFTTEIDHIISMLDLEDAMREELPDLNVRVTASYNTHEIALTDLYESAEQLSDAGHVWDVATFILALHGRAGMNLNVGGSGASYIREQDTQALIDAVNDSVVTKGDRTLIVAHSQGSLFANDAYSRLPINSVMYRMMDSVGIYAVAPAAFEVRPTNGTGNQYIKHDLDILTQLGIGLRKNIDVEVVRGSSTLRRPGLVLLPPVIPFASWKIDFSLDTMQAVKLHALTTYISPSYNLRQRLFADIREQFSKLKDPYPPCSNGPSPSNFTTYLPSTLNGFSVTTNRCLGANDLTAGALTLDASGNYESSGCFAGYRGLESASYRALQNNFSQCTSQNVAGSCRAELDVDGTQVTDYYTASPHLGFATAQWSPGSKPRSYTNLSLSGRLDFDPRRRVLGWLSLLPVMQCRPADGASAFEDGYRIEVLGDSVSVVGPRGTVATASGAQLTGETFEEKFDVGFSPPAVNVASSGERTPIVLGGRYSVSASFKLNGRSVSELQLSFLFDTPNGPSRFLCLQ